MTELISVIVPIYNVVEYLEYCVKSICEQTYSNIEVILVDDGSTDGSGELCDKLAMSDDRIKVIHQTNQGAAGARNTGLDSATGSYISIIDGDDYIWPEMYETLLDALRQKKADFACCPYEHVSKQEMLDREKRFNKEINLFVLQQKDIYRHLFDYHTMWVIQPNKLYKGSMFENYRFPQGHFYEDEYAAHRLIKNVQCAVYVDVPFYRYFVRQGSATKRAITSRKLFLLDALIDRINYFKEENLIDLLPMAEKCFFEAYRSVAVGMTDRTRVSKRNLRTIVKQYREILRCSEVTAEISKKLMLKRKLYLLCPRFMEKLLLIKNR